VKLYDNYAKIYVTDHGKEGTKFLMVIDSYPYLKRWLDKHPLRKNEDAYLFINLGDTNKYEQLKPSGINKHLREKLKALEIHKSVTCYSLKRYGVTYRRLRGDSDATIQHTAHWTSSKQLHTYDFSEVEDTFKIELVKRGLIKDSKFKQFEPSTKKCIYCETVNAMTDLECSNCHRLLDREKIVEEQEKKDKEMEELKASIKNMTKTVVRQVISELEQKKK
jgi:hypothetical protein